MLKNGVEIDKPKIAEFCKKWKIREMALFGSIIRDNFRPDSDVDLLLEFFPDAGLSLFDLVDIQDELKIMLGREVDVVEKEGIINPYRRATIFPTMEVIYAVSGT